MFKKIKDSFESGTRQIKWFASLISDRLRVEFSVIKILHDRDRKEKDRAEKMRTIGERVFEMRDQSDKSILKDNVVSDLLSELEKLDTEIEEMKKKAAEISRLEA